VAVLIALALCTGSAAATCVGVSHFVISSDGPLTIGYDELGQIVFVCVNDDCYGVYERPCTLPDDP